MIKILLAVWGILTGVLMGTCLMLFIKQKKLKNILKLDEENREEMKAFLLKQRTMRHDFNIHLMSLGGMLDTGRYEECREYLQKMMDLSNEVAQVMPLDDPAISAMLNQMLEEAKKCGCRMECYLYDDLHEICCDAYEVNQILGNLIRNAMEAEQEITQEMRKITVTTLQRRGQIILRVENRWKKEDKLDQKIFEYGISGKKNHSGIGLAATKRIVERYHGTIFAEQSCDNVCMIVQLPATKERGKKVGIQINKNTEDGVN